MKITAAQAYAFDEQADPFHLSSARTANDVRALIEKGAPEAIAVRDFYAPLIEDLLDGMSNQIESRSKQGLESAGLGLNLYKYKEPPQGLLPLDALHAYVAAVVTDELKDAGFKIDTPVTVKKDGFYYVDMNVSW